MFTVIKKSKLLRKRKYLIKDQTLALLKMCMVSETQALLCV